MPHDYDYLILGSGIAGLYAALLAAQHGRTCVLTKGPIEESNTKYAQGGIAAAIGSSDDLQAHLDDTLRVGAGLSDRPAVEILVNEAADRVRRLTELGVPFDTQDGTQDGAVALSREAAHSRPRIHHAGGDRTGDAIETVMVDRVRDAGVDVLECHTATDLLLENNCVTGVEARTPNNLPTSSDNGITVTARWTILATGGAGRLYTLTTNPEVATGDGMALAFRAGAALRDMEFVQFHPTALAIPNVPVFLITEAMRGEGAILCNPTDGRRFMPDYHPDAELAPRDIVARSIATEMQKAGTDHVLLDISHLDADFVATRFPGAYQHCRTHNLDITSQPIPVAPAAHYMMGGVLTDTDGRTTLPGLLACGEVANTGVHGANRLASNSLLETVVFAQRAIDATLSANGLALNNKATPEPDDIRALDLNLTATAPDLPTLQALLWRHAGIVRDEHGLAEAAAIIDAWPSHPSSPDLPTRSLNNMTTLGRLIVQAALDRHESRGAHYRTDYPTPDPAWERHITYRRTRHDP
jgi:L-aspartate oxidase